ncbi:hypothetical protein L226DRAFT_468618 [Lentinus tigrinus ALCF2SS1-7]|uniref:Uncharacterized protein n=1 Tax=Lentinus tigrinus ALCF2SS1-6 TaxID=1328759 RepID=A0A5C2RZ82_9APHY|nr:hypothetical protein L227DRAFT_508589 [Lentinus tigrinus ALCF2SS1-6]RPD71463.1 hypothetical protein L226DRAFT_468618 [Lentinus tigrinus ALCF2SS1-7]
MPDLQYVPRTHAFAVIRMDPVAMVRHLGDPEATRAAEALTPKSYPVYVEMDSALPFPDRPWYGLTVSLVGPHLRPAVDEDCVSQEMCSPIFPNTNHPKGRVPVRTQPDFPFNGCYFWSKTSMKIRVCARPEGFDWEGTTLLRGEEYVRWMRYESEDMMRRVRAQRARERQPEPSESVPARPNPAAHSIRVDDSPDTEGAVGLMCADFDVCSYAESDISTIDTFVEMGLSPDSMLDLELQPIFHLWGDLAANLTQDEIPSPIDLLQECDTITR